MANREPCACPGASEIISDLREEDLLDLEAGERLWKLYCFRAPGHATELRHRIYTKMKIDGRLAMVTFAAHNPWNVEENGEGSGPRPVRSALARVPDLSPADLDRLITALRAQSDQEACEEIDLSELRPVEQQWRWLLDQASR
jgi:hypothetical protein